MDGWILLFIFLNMLFRSLNNFCEFRAFFGIHDYFAEIYRCIDSLDFITKMQIPGSLWIAMIHAYLIKLFSIKEFKLLPSSIFSCKTQNGHAFKYRRALNCVSKFGSVIDVLFQKTSSILTSENLLFEISIRMFNFLPSESENCLYRDSESNAF